MEDITSACLNQASMEGASYADVRVVDGSAQSIAVKNGRIEELRQSTNVGFGVRVLIDGAWGFAASSKLTPEEAALVTRRAADIARASGLAKRHDVELAPAEAKRDTFTSPMERDPFEVPVADKLEVLTACDKDMRSDPRIVVARATMDCWRHKTIFMNTQGSHIEQDITECGAGIQATASEGGDVQVRSYPQAHGGDYATRGYELIEEMHLTDNAARVGEEALALLSAKECPSATTTIVLGGDQTALQVHESIGHPTELDRVLGMEADFAGTSFLSTADAGELRYGSQIVNVTADATIPGALGSFGYDDEGVPAQRNDIIRDGLFVGFLSSRETAPAMNHLSSGAARADGWNRIPLVRMTNINLLPGHGTLEDLIADVADGLYLVTNKSWSIDDKRLNFQFATEIGWEIKDGKLGAMIKNANYTGITPEFWGSCDAIAGQEAWHVWGVPNCGKGEPMQVAHVGHGVAPARFRNVKVGVGK